MKKFAVLGAGNAGSAFAGHLGMKGYEVRLYEDPAFEKGLEQIKKNGGIYLYDNIEGFGPVTLATTDMEQVVKGADAIIIAVPQFAHEAMFSKYIQYAEDGQVVMFFPGNYASFRFYDMIKASGRDITLLEGESIPYGARKRIPGSVHIIGLKQELHIACMPASRTLDMVNELNKFSNVFVPAKNTLEVSINNTNFVVHCTGMALNAGRVESTKGAFSLYWEGMSPSVCNVMQDIDSELIAIGKKFGFAIPDSKSSFKAAYGLKGDTLYEVIQNSENHGHSGAPATLKDRYIMEDAPAGLCAAVTLGEVVGVPTPVCSALLTICSTLSGIDFKTTGLSMEHLGIKGLSIPEILDRIG